MNVLYIGFYYPDGMIERLLKLNSVVDFPGYTFQNALLSGLDKLYPNFKIISSAYMSSFPRNKQVIWKRTHFSHKGDDSNKDVFTGLINIPIIKEISKFIRIRKEIKRSLVKGKNNIVVCYEVHTPFLLAIISLRRRVSKTCLIVPDLPEYMNAKQNILYRLAKKIDRIIINYSIRRIDCFALFSSHMQDKLPIGNKPWILLEGIYKETEELEYEKEQCKTILYTGNLARNSGVIDLLNAFQLIESSDYRLWIRGNGEKALVEEIHRRIEQDSRITYFPPMSKRDILILQRRATVLVNPIRPSQSQTKYFFPSKTMEYLASGTPTIMYKLDCLPLDYHNHLLFVEEETIESLKDKIVEVCEMDKDKYVEFGQSAYNFIIEEKNPKKQAEKLYKLINA